MSEIVEPHPLLIEYFQKASELDYESDRWDEKFALAGEWHYIPSNLESTIFLLKRLEEINLLQSEVNICDCGIGLGTTMFDLYLQSKELNSRNFTFTGIEKHTKYTNFLKQNLIQYWNEELNLIEGDMIEQDYSKYNLIYSYSPFNKEEKLMPFYQKIISETPVGTIFLGLDTYRIMTYGGKWGSLISDFERLKSYRLDDMFVYQKVHSNTL